MYTRVLVREDQYQSSCRITWSQTNQGAVKYNNYITTPFPSSSALYKSSYY